MYVFTFVKPYTSAAFQNDWIHPTNTNLFSFHLLLLLLLLHFFFPQREVIEEVFVFPSDTPWD